MLVLALIAVATLRGAFPRPQPASLAVSKVAAAPDGVVAIALSHVSGGDRARAAIELWDGDRDGRPLEGLAYFAYETP